MVEAYIRGALINDIDGDDFARLIAPWLTDEGRDSFYRQFAPADERFTAEELTEMREAEPGIKIIAHPECPPDVIAEADFTGSTGGMINWVKEHRPDKVLLVTECSMSDNVAVETPGVQFIRPCNLCPHMKRITLPKILDSLVYMKHEVVIDSRIAERARRAVERMVNLNV